jgi:transglutaminase-like putative cysteine protease
VLYAIAHQTTYGYESAVSVSQHLVHLRPRESPRQQLLEFSLSVEPAATGEFSRTDYYGNAATFLAIENPHDGLSIVARSRVRVSAPEWPDPASTPAWEIVRDKCASDVLTPDSEAGEFRFDSPHIPTSDAFAAYGADSFPAGCPLLDGVLDFTTHVFNDFTFDRRATNVATPLEEVFQKRSGVCQDFAHLAICCLRSLGLPARYVSGYLETLPPPGRQRLVGADASHAWFAVWCPGCGWIDVDPTNNMLAGDRHITVAWGRDFSDVSPVHGVVVGGGAHRLGVSVDVERIDEPAP